MLEEREIFRLLKDNVEGTLHFKSKKGITQIGEIIPVRRGFGTRKGRPDFVIWLRLNMDILGVNVRAKLPILVEAEEAGGLAAADKDFRSFFRTDEIRLPAVIIGGKTRKEKEKVYVGKIRLKLSQLPSGRLEINR